MPLRATLATALLVVAGARQVAAQQPSVPVPLQSPETHWSGQGQLGVQVHVGVTETTGITAQHTLRRLREPLELDLLTAASYSESSTEATRLGSTGELERVIRRTRTEDYRAQLKGRKHLPGDSHWVGLVAWHRSPNQGLRHQARSSFGYGWKLVHKPQTTLSAEVTVGYLAELHTDGDRVRFPAGALALDLERSIGTSGSLSGTVEVVEKLPGGGELLVLATGSLHVPLGEHLGLSVSTSVTYDRRPADAVFEPTGEGQLVTEPEKLYGNLQVGLGIQW